MKRLKRNFITLILAVSFLVLSVQTFNVNAVVDDETVTLNIVYAWENEKIPNAQFEIYYVADISDSGIFTLADNFKDYPVNVNVDNEDYQTLAQTLYGYVLLDDVSPTEIGQTNSDGELTFSTSANNLKQGMYLVTADETVFGEYKYTVDPYIISLPGFDSETNSFEYSVTSYPKVEREEEEKDTDTSDSFVAKSVLKQWDDFGFENERPDSIEVKLLKDGVLYDTVQLSEDNNWYYIWNNLDKNSDWTVVETPVDHYTVLVANEGATFIVTNTKTDISTDTSTDSDTDSVTNSTPSTPNLPQTGTYWWAVPVLLMLGLVFLLIGLAVRRGANDE